MFIISAVTVFFKGNLLVCFVSYSMGLFTPLIVYRFLYLYFISPLFLSWIWSIWYRDRGEIDLEWSVLFIFCLFFFYHWSPMALAPLFVPRLFSFLLFQACRCFYCYCIAVFFFRGGIGRMNVICVLLLSSFHNLLLMGTVMFCSPFILCVFIFVIIIVMGFRYFIHGFNFSYGRRELL